MVLHYNDLSESIQGVHGFLTGGVKKALQKEKNHCKIVHIQGNTFFFIYYRRGLKLSRFCAQRLVGHHDALLSFQLWHPGCRAQNCCTS